MSKKQKVTDAASLLRQVTAIRRHEETRPKHAGPHQDQNRKHHTKAARRAAKQCGYDRDRDDR